MNPNHKSELGELADPSAPAFLGPCDLSGLSGLRVRRFHGMMLLIRAVEEQIADWVEQSRVQCPCHLGIGQEAIATGVAAALRKDDRLFGNHRSHGHYLAAGGDVYRLLAEVLGRADGCASGMGGSMHLQDRSCGFFGSVPIVAGTIPIAVGAALAAKMDGGDAISVAYFGDGACEEGVFHESLNLASVYGLPVLFVCENNLYSSHLDVALRQPSDRMARYAQAHGVRSAVVDGNDVAAVARAAAELVAQARTDRRPAFLEAVTYRWRGHVGPKEDIDVGVRRSMEHLASWKRRDPIRRLEQSMLAEGVCEESELTEIHRRVRESVGAHAAQALAAGWPADENLLGLVFADASR